MNSVFRIFIILSCIINSFYVFPQDNFQKIESLIQKADTEVMVDSIIKEVAEISPKNPQKALLYLNEITFISESLDYKSGIAQAANDKGIVYFQLGQFEDAAMVFEDAIKNFRLADDRRKMANNYNNLAAAYALNRQFEKSSLALEQALQINIEIDNKMGIADSYTSLGAFNSDYLKNPEEALLNYKKAEAIFKELDKTEELPMVYNNMGEVYIGLKNYDIAKEIYNKVLTLNKRVDNEPSWARTQFGLGEVALGKREGKNAIFHFTNALDVFQSIKEDDMIATVSHHMASASAMSDEFNEAIRLDTLALNIRRKMDNHAEAVVILQSLSEHHKALGDYKESLAYQEELVVAKDSLQSKNERIRIEELNLKYDDERKNNEIKALEATSKRNKERFWGFIGILALALGFLTYLLYRSRKSKKIENELRDKEKQLLKSEIKLNEIELEKGLNELREQQTIIVEKNKLIKEFQSKLHTEKEKENTENEDSNAEDLQEMKILTESDWEGFKSSFQKVYPAFIEKIHEQHNGLSAAELRLCLLLKLELSKGQIAETLGISENSARKSMYRLRKRLNFEQDHELRKFVQNI